MIRIDMERRKPMNENPIYTNDGTLYTPEVFDLTQLLNLLMLMAKGE